MAKIKKKELRELSNDELNSNLNDLRKELMKLRTEASTRTATKNPSQIKQTKKIIAQIITILKKKPKEVKIKA